MDDADISRALDFVRTHFFKDVRPGVAKIVVPVVHQMKTGRRGRKMIIEAGQKLAEGCVSIAALAVEHSSLNVDTLKQTVNGNYQDHMVLFDDYSQLEDQVTLCINM